LHFLQAYLTDNWNASPMGRRRPFILTGCWLVTIVLCLLFYPPCGESEEKLLSQCDDDGMATTWFTIFYPLFFVSLTYIMIPLDALGPELTDNYDDRSLLFSISNLFTLSGLIFGVFLPAGCMAYSTSSAGWTNMDYASFCLPDDTPKLDFAPDAITGDADAGILNNDPLPNKSFSKQCKGKDGYPGKTGYVQDGWDVAAPAKITCEFEHGHHQSPPTNKFWTLENPFKAGPLALSQSLHGAMTPLFPTYNANDTCDAVTGKTPIKWYYGLDIGKYSSDCYCKAENRPNETGICDNSDPNQPASCYCYCRNQCMDNDNMKAERNGYPLAALILGIYFIVTCSIAFKMLRERGQGEAEESLGHADSHHEHLEEGEELHEEKAQNTHAEERKAEPLVTGMLNTLNNKPFCQLLPAWTADAIGLSVMTSLILYEVMYVVEVEYSNGCAKGSKANCDDEDGLFTNFYCSSICVAGLCIIAFLAGAMSALPVWLFISKKLGKFKTWLLWSFVSAITNSGLCFIGSGDVMPLLVVVFFNGIPQGANFLSDSILSDVIDYDEFLTGKRNEATYTMFRSFLPKMAGIPASVLPLAFLPAMGYVSTVGGIPQQQPELTKWYIRLCFSVIPLVFALLSFYFKTKFVMRTKEQTDKIGVGIGTHLKKKPFNCPLSGVPISILHLTADEEEMEGLLGHFPGVKNISRLADPGGDKELLKHTVSQFRTAAACLVVSFVSAILTVLYLQESETLSFIPVLCVVSTGILTVATTGTVCRKKAALEIIEQMKSGGKITSDLIKKTIEHREMLHAAFTKIQRISKKKEPALPVSPTPGTSKTTHHTPAAESSAAAL
jgi:Na+/melibiose symporter-like transporter